MLEEAFKSLFAINMATTRGERVLVFSDTIRSDEEISPEDRERRVRLLETAEQAGRYAQRVYGNCQFVAFPTTSASGAEPPEQLWRAAFGEATVEGLIAAGLFSKILDKNLSADELAQAQSMVLADRQAVARVVVALANNSTSHTRFRSLINIAGGRFASLPHFDPEMFFTSMRVDWHSLAKRTRRLAAAVNRAEEIRVETPNGTRMRFGKEGRTAEGDDGLLTAAGSFGNLPAGEVYLAPREGTSEGRMVLEYAPTRKLATPLTLIVEEGNVVAMEGDEPYRQKLEQKFAENPNCRNIAELGIGTNDRASRPDNILEAEKILGTIHIALGDNSGFGGTVQAPFHEDYVFYRPTLTAVAADGTETVLLTDGRLLVE